MKKLALFLLLFHLSVFAKEYYAKLEPKELYTMASNVVAKVVLANRAKEGEVLGESDFIMLDDALDRDELKEIEKKVSLIEKTLKLNASVLENLASIVERKQKNYDRIKDLKIKSSIEKDREFFDLVTTQNQYLATQKEVNNLEIQLSDLKLREAHLKQSIEDKHIKAPSMMLYKLLVKKHQVVAMGTPLAKVADISKGRLTLYVHKDDIEGIKGKSIYLDGKKTAYHVSNVWDVADEVHLSSYKVEIIVDKPQIFSKLVKVEFK